MEADLKRASEGPRRADPEPLREALHFLGEPMSEGALLQQLLPSEELFESMMRNRRLSRPNETGPRSSEPLQGLYSPGRGISTMFLQRPPPARPPPASAVQPRKEQPKEIKQRKPRKRMGPSWCRWCNSTETPEWRRGPNGPRTLCNACGLQYAKEVKEAREAKEAREREERAEERARARARTLLHTAANGKPAGDARPAGNPLAFATTDNTQAIPLPPKLLDGAPRLAAPAQPPPVQPTPPPEHNHRPFVPPSVGTPAPTLPTHHTSVQPPNAPPLTAFLHSSRGGGHPSTAPP